jgi:hypothetical protein
MGYFLTMLASCITLSVAAVVTGVATLLVVNRRRLLGVQLELNALVVVPLIDLLMTQASGSSPTRQFNERSGPRMGWWSLRGDFWPLAMLMLLSAILATLCASSSPSWRWPVSDHDIMQQ